MKQCLAYNRVEQADTLPAVPNVCTDQSAVYELCDSDNVYEPMPEYI